MNTSNSKKLIHKLKKILKMLCKKPGEQIEYLSELGVEPSADELALEFDDCVGSFRSFFQEGLISQKTLEWLMKLDEKLNLMSSSGDKETWDFESLKTSNDWKEVRKIAANALDSMQI